MTLYRAAEFDRAALNHAQFYVNQLASLRARYMHDPGTTMTRVRKSLPQMRQALAWMQLHTTDDLEIGMALVRFVHTSIKFTSLVITPTDWAHWLDIAIDITKYTQQEQERLDFMLERSSMAFSQGDLDTASFLSADCLELAQHLNDNRRIARSYYTGALLQQKLGHLQAARDQMRQAQHYYELAGDQNGIGRVRSFQAQQAIDASEYDTAYALLRENIAMWRETGDLRQMAIEQYQLGVMLENRFMHEDALGYLESARATFQDLNERRYEAYCLQILCGLHIETHQLDAAWTFIERAYELFAETGDRRGMAGSLNYFGRIRSHQHRMPEALDYHAQAGKLAAEIRYYFHLTESHRTRADIYARLNDIPAAGEHLTQAIGYAQKSGVVLLLLSVLITAIGVLRADGRDELATQTLQMILTETDEAYIMHHIQPYLTDEIPPVGDNPPSLDGIVSRILGIYA